MIVVRRQPVFGMLFYAREAKSYTWCRRRKTNTSKLKTTHLLHISSLLIRLFCICKEYQKNDGLNQQTTFGRSVLIFQLNKDHDKCTNRKALQDRLDIIGSMDKQPFKLKQKQIKVCCGRMSESRYKAVCMLAFSVLFILVKTNYAAAS